MNRRETSRVLRLTLFLLVSILPFLAAEPLYSPRWGFKLDLPAGYVFSEGNGVDRFSFTGPGGAQCDVVVYAGTYPSMKNLVEDTIRRLRNQGEVGFFEYQDKLAALVELRFGDSAGWGLCVELSPGSGADKVPPMLLALAYGPVEKTDLELFHLSALDSIAPSAAERRYPGPVMEFGYPRGAQRQTALALPGLTALIRENDADAAQALVDREYSVLRRYLFAENWSEAWARFYRIIYRDSWDRLADAVFQLERNWNAAGTAKLPASAGADNPSAGERALAEKALTWVQGFTYERDLMGSDFVNLVSAVTEGRGDCDSRALLWAMILAQADIPAAIMVSRNHNHAMGLADIDGTGARFEAEGRRWLVAETTAPVPIGLISRELSDIESWLGVVFE